MPIYVITGTNRGLGLEWVKQLSADAANTIIATVRDITKTSPALTELKDQSKGRVHILQCETSDDASVAAFAKELGSTLKSLNPPSSSIDILINNAGMNNIDPVQKAIGLDRGSFERHMHNNVYSVASVTLALQPYLPKGSLVANITSSMGSMTENRGDKSGPPKDTAYTAYCMSKAALNMLTVHQAAELKEKGVTVIAVCPGWVQTDLGTQWAPLKAPESIEGMRKVLARIDSKDTGRWYRYSGDEVPW